MGDLYLDAIEYNDSAILLYLDFLIYEKTVISLEDSTSALDIYFQDKHAAKMNRLLDEYKNKLGGM